MKSDISVTKLNLLCTYEPDVTTLRVLLFISKEKSYIFLHKNLLFHKPGFSLSLIPSGWSHDMVAKGIAYTSQGRSDHHPSDTVMFCGGTVNLGGTVREGRGQILTTTLEYYVTISIDLICLKTCEF